MRNKVTSNIRNKLVVLVIFDNIANFRLTKYGGYSDNHTKKTSSYFTFVVRQIKNLLPSSAQHITDMTNDMLMGILSVSL